jgi:hypothetical protein
MRIITRVEMKKKTINSRRQLKKNWEYIIFSTFLPLRRHREILSTEFRIKKNYKKQDASGSLRRTEMEFFGFLNEY